MNTFAQLIQCESVRKSILQTCIASMRSAAVSEYRGNDAHVIKPLRSDVILRIVHLADTAPTRPPRILIDDKVEIPMILVAPLIWAWGDGVHVGSLSKLHVQAFTSGVTLVHNILLDDFSERDRVHTSCCRDGMGIRTGLGKLFPLDLPEAVYDCAASRVLVKSEIRPLRVGQPVDELMASDRLEWQVGDAPFTFTINDKVHTAVSEAVMRAVAAGAMGSRDCDTCTLAIGPVACIGVDIRLAVTSPHEFTEATP